MVRVSAGRRVVRRRPAHDELAEDRAQGQPDLRGRHGHGGGYGVHRAVRHRDRQRLRASRRRRAADRRHPHRHDRRRVEREEGQDDRHAAARLRVQHGRRRRGGPRRAQRHPHLRGAADAGRANHRRTWHHDRFRHVHRLADRRRQAAGRQVPAQAHPPREGRVEHRLHCAHRRLVRHAVRAARAASAVVRADHGVLAVLRSGVRHPDRRR